MHAARQPLLHRLLIRAKKSGLEGTSAILYVICLAVTWETSCECHFQLHDGVFASVSIVDSVDELLELHKRQHLKQGAAG